MDLASEKVVLEVPARRGSPTSPATPAAYIDFDAQRQPVHRVGDDVNPHSSPPAATRRSTGGRGTIPTPRRTVGQHQRPARQDPADPPRGRRHVHDPDRQPVRAGHATDPARDLRDGLPQPVPLRRRHGDRLGLHGRLRPRRRQRRPANRGPEGLVEWNVIKQPGNYGWPYCLGDNEPYATSTSPPTVRRREVQLRRAGQRLAQQHRPDRPAAGRCSRRLYGYGVSVPGVISAGRRRLGADGRPGLPLRRRTSPSATKFPAYFDGKPFFYEWGRNYIHESPLGRRRQGPEDQPVPARHGVPVADGPAVRPGRRAVPARVGRRLRPRQPELGPLPDRLRRRRPRADRPGRRRRRTPAGARSTVQFSSAGSTDPDGDEITYAGTSTATARPTPPRPNPTHTYTANGNYEARLTVTDHGRPRPAPRPCRSSSATPRPTVTSRRRRTAAFFDWGDDLAVAGLRHRPRGRHRRLRQGDLQPALGHDEHAHPTTRPTPARAPRARSSDEGHAEAQHLLGHRRPLHRLRRPGRLAAR